MLKVTRRVALYSLCKHIPQKYVRKLSGNFQGTACCKHHKCVLFKTLLCSASKAGIPVVIPPCHEYPAHLQVLGLADIGVTDADKVQLQGLVHALTVGPTQLVQMDFDANYIGKTMLWHKG